MSKKILVGVVVSDKMEKTVVVKVERLLMHPIYKKFYKKHRKYMAHDESNSLNIGDFVSVEETKPFSKKKRWIVKELIKKASI